MLPSLDLDNIISSINAQSTSETVSKNIGTVFMMTFNEENEARVVIENGKVKIAETIEEKIQMFIQVLLRTELDKFKIYEDTDFGMTYFNFKGIKVSQGFILSELKRELKDNLKKISLVDSVNPVDNFEAVLSSTKLEVSFNVNLADSSTIAISEVV